LTDVLIPCPNTVENRVKKSGYSIYHTVEKGNPYAAIVDESMMPGSEKMLMVLGTDSSRQYEGALRKQADSSGL
jgi:hypothetical protein